MADAGQVAGEPSCQSGGSIWYRLSAFLATDLKEGELDFGRESRFDPAAQVSELRGAIDVGRKSTRWKLRSRIGDRVQWYEEPEEVGHGR
jgi:hypothetical protein